ncbi:MAG TPA: hypothetical protein PK095_01685 [Myxococcota bacterium]|nr:hypothetical protein [Myxococcota bacterium]
MGLASLLGCGTEPTSGGETSDTAADIGELPDVEAVSCGPDDPTLGNLSWTTDVTEGCTHYLGSIHLPDALNADAFAGLGGLREVRGSITIFRPHVEVDFTLLGQLEVIDGELSYRLDNTPRRALSGPPRLREVGELRIEDNPDLEDLSDFVPELQTVRGDVRILSNPKLSTQQINTFLARLEVLGEVILDDGHASR